MLLDIDGEYAKWCLQDLGDSDLTEELSALSQDQGAKADCFYRNLSFGTGGLRGVIGVGTNRLNIHTVGKATQGYADYLLEMGGSPSVAIAYDSRIKSNLFARHTAEVLAANRVHVFLYPELMPTPALSFAVRHLRCSGGIVITASHNPSKYNGYKVYGKDGGQITKKAAKDILTKIEKLDIFQDVKRMAFDDAVAEGWISYIGEDTVAAYLHAVSSQSLYGGMEGKEISIVYTPLNGTGLSCVTRILRDNGFANVSIVEEQREPDGRFPTCPYPNPEIKEALELGIRDAKRMGSDLVLATDPDCDRVGIAVKDSGDFKLLTGNEVGMLMLDYICKRRIETGRMPERPVFMKTIVTIDMAERVARDYGVEVINVLTGFKYIGEQIGRLEEAGEEGRYILGFEESYGYLTGPYVRDKDGVNGSLMVCEMMAYYRAQGVGLLDVLDSLYHKYGYSLNTLHSFEFEGLKGYEEMQRIMQSFREMPPVELAGRQVVDMTDYQEETGLPKADVLKYRLEGDCSFVVRPSGTEPKLKVYLSVCGEDRESAEAGESVMAHCLKERIYGGDTGLCQDKA